MAIVARIQSRRVGEPARALDSPSTPSTFSMSRSRTSQPSSQDQDAFDLSLVADAMAFESKPKPTQSVPAPQSEEEDEDNDRELLDSGLDTDALKDLDLSSLTEADRKLVQPLLDLLNLDGVNLDAAEGAGLGEVNRRLDEADGVARGLEGMLDGLLEKLGGLLEEDLDGELAGLEEEAEEKVDDVEEEAASTTAASSRTVPLGSPNDAKKEPSA